MEVKGRELQNRLRAGARGAGGGGLTYLFREQEAGGKAVGCVEDASCIPGGGGSQHKQAKCGTSGPCE